MKLRIPDQKTTAPSPTGPVLVRPFQIVLPVALVVGGRVSQTFPAILDIGHTHNFSLRAQHVRDWVKMRLKQIGRIKVNDQFVPLMEADVEIDGGLVRCLDGISVFPQGHPGAPRLPLLGLRAIVRNNIKVVIDSGEVSIG